MAARRAAARAAAAEPPPPEPIPEPEPEPKEPEPPKTSVTDEQLGKTKSNISTGDGIRERIIERIIICPGGMNPYMQQQQPPPPTPPVPYNLNNCCPCQEGGKKKKGKDKCRKKGHEEDEDGLCKHPFCIVQRAKTKPQGLPWASGMYQGPPQQVSRPPAPVVICQRPVICQCKSCSSSQDSEEECEEEDDPPRQDTEQFMTFMNMVFAAANVMNERSGVF